MIFPQRIFSYFVIVIAYLHYDMVTSIQVGQCDTFRDSSCCVEQRFSTWLVSYDQKQTEGFNFDSVFAS